MVGLCVRRLVHDSYYCFASQLNGEITLLHFELSKLFNTVERPVAKGATVTQEGSALVWNATGNGVQPSSGAAGEIFAGVSFSQQMTPLQFPEYDSLTATSPASGQPTVTTGNLPIAGTIRVYDVTTGTLQTAGTPTTTANQYSIAGSVITLNAAAAGHVIQVSYRYAPTTAQVLSVQGNIPPGGSSGLLLNSTGVVLNGDVVTTEFDTSVDWTTVSATNPVTLGANGIFTIGGTGTALPGAFVTQLPTVGTMQAGASLLGLRIRA